jgi:hypothetical protein
MRNRQTDCARCWNSELVTLDLAQLIAKYQHGQSTVLAQLHVVEGADTGVVELFIHLGRGVNYARP